MSDGNLLLHNVRNLNSPRAAGGSNSSSENEKTEKEVEEEEEDGEEGTLRQRTRVHGKSIYIEYYIHMYYILMGCVIVLVLIIDCCDQYMYSIT